jgi:hypothetical protein
MPQTNRAAFHHFSLAINRPVGEPRMPLSTARGNADLKNSTPRRGRGFATSGQFLRTVDSSVGDTRLRELQQAIEQQPYFAHFAAVVEAFQRRHVDRKGTVVADLAELLNKFAVIDFTLAHADVQLFFR